MKIEGKRVKRKRLIQTDRYVVEVEVVITAGDPSEPCCESETVQFLKQVREKAEQADEAWLRQHGKLYAAVEAA